MILRRHGNLLMMIRRKKSLKNMMNLTIRCCTTCCRKKSRYKKNQMNSSVVRCFLMELNSFPSFCKNSICSDPTGYCILKGIRSFSERCLKNCFLHYYMNSGRYPDLKAFSQRQSYYRPLCCLSHYYEGR